jgi:T5SS/PEP-CTERM-associated repeat protein
MFRRFLSAVIICALSLSWALPVRAAVRTWATAITGGSWTDASNWTGGVPASSDTASFNKPGTYTVTFSNVFQDLADMTVSAGTVTFERVVSPATLLIQNVSGGDDLTITGATLNMGNTLPVNIAPADSANIHSGGTLNVKVGSLLHPFQVYIDPGGTLAMSSSGDVLAEGGVYIGFGSPGISTAAVNVTGFGSTLTAGAIFVGYNGNGALTIQNNGQASGQADIIGDLAGTVGTAIVTGAGSSWSDSSLIIGSSGSGTLTISDGGLVTVGAGAGPVSINALSTLNIGGGGAAGVLHAGTVSNNGVLNFNHTDTATISAPISGNGIAKTGGSGDTTLADVSAFTGSFFAQGGRMILQGNTNGSDYLAAANGTLRFSGSFVNLGSRIITAAANGAIEYEGAYISAIGGVLRGPGTHTVLPSAIPTVFNGVTTFNSTSIVQNGAAFLYYFTNGGTITNNAPLVFNGGMNAVTGVINVNSTLDVYDIGNSGVVTVGSGGTINNQVGNFISGGGSRTTINSGGSINLLGGTTLELNGALLVNNGSITGTVNVNYGSLAKGVGSYDVVNVNEGGAYSPGNSPGVSTATSVDFQSGSFTSAAPRLVLELGGTTPGAQYDQLHVTGLLALNGTLDVRLVDAGAGLFAPAAGNSFDILDWGTLSGTFSSIQLPTLAGSLAWNTSQLYTTGVLSVVSPGLPGDFNNNGVVDAADYVVWRKGLGTTYTKADYDVWRANFGQTAGNASGASANAAVPEPTTLVPLMFSAVGWRLRRRRAA